jgi:nitrite reductase (NADH) large subunit
METAGALANRGGHVTLLEGHEWPMPRQLNRAAGERLARHVEEMKITLRTHARAEEVVGDERVRAVALEDGTSLPADLVVIATGIRTNSYLARMAGLEVNSGVVVDNRLHSSHPSILAAGDVAEHRGTVYGIWGPSQFQGKIAGLNAAGVSTEFGGVPRSNTLKVLGLDLFSIGATTAEDGSYRTFEDEQGGAYFRFVFHDGHLAGAILLGDTSLMPAVKQAVEQRTEFGALLARRPEVKDLLEFLGAR